MRIKLEKGATRKEIESTYTSRPAGVSKCIKVGNVFFPLSTNPSGKHPNINLYDGKTNYYVRGEYTQHDYSLIATALMDKDGEGVFYVRKWWPAGNFKFEETTFVKVSVGSLKVRGTRWHHGGEGHLEPPKIRMSIKNSSGKVVKTLTVDVNARHMQDDYEATISVNRELSFENKNSTDTYTVEIDWYSGTFWLGGDGGRVCFFRLNNSVIDVKYNREVYL